MFIPPTGIRPGYHQGFARSAGESAFPELWDNLIGSYPFTLGITGDSIPDISGFKHTATNNGAIWEVSKMGWGLNPKGDNNNFIAVDSVTPFQFERTDPFSISVLIEFDSVALTVQTLAANIQSANPYNGFEFRMIGDKLTFYLGNNTTDNAIKVTDTAALFVNTLYYLTVTYDGNSAGSGVKIYVNENKRSLTITQDNLSATTLSNRAVGIGRRSTFTDPNPWPVDGQIGLVSIFDIELTKNRIQKSSIDPLGFLQLKQPVWKAPAVVGGGNARLIFLTGEM